MRAEEPGSAGELLQLQMKAAPVLSASVEGSVENVPPTASQSACDCANGFGLVLDHHPAGALGVGPGKNASLRRVKDQLRVDADTSLGFS
jgi:hypothetical protein